MNHEVISQLASMRHAPLHNYIVPGLTSWLIMDRGNHGKIRMFENTREQHHFITPHSHRFNFSCCVIRGVVMNTLWHCASDKSKGDPYMVTSSKYLGTPGQYENTQKHAANYYTETAIHKEGDWYAMKFNEIHSIKFSKGALVLFIESQAMTDISYTLEPFVDGEYLQTMHTEPWMFKKG